MAQAWLLLSSASSCTPAASPGPGATAGQDCRLVFAAPRDPGAGRHPAPTAHAQRSAATTLAEGVQAAGVQGEHRVPQGHAVRYTLSEAARTTFTVQVKKSGRKLGRRCVAPKRSNLRKKRCHRFVKVGGFAHSGKAGTNRLRFSGRVKRRALTRGRYRLLAVAVDAAGNRSTQLRRAFRIIR